MRELPSRKRLRTAPRGITPACAGITRMKRISGRILKDHPRVCGNYYIARKRAIQVVGSPPRVRELPRRRRFYFTNSRITPACAGITPPVHYADRAVWDHPRVCGNYALGVDRRRLWEGSPPRVRELPIAGIRSAAFSRITPACAGITVRLYGR